MGIGKRGLIRHRIRVEQDQVRCHPLLDSAPVFQSKFFAGRPVILCTAFSKEMIFFSRT